MPRLQLRLFGSIEARLEPGGPVALPTRKAQALLAYLALSGGRPQARDKLAALLWGGIREDSARNSLRQALFALRRALAAVEPPVIVADADTVAFDRSAVEVDVHAFERSIGDGSPEALGAAAELYGGDLLAGISLQEPPFEEWLLTERERLRELALEALARRLAHQRNGGATESAIQTALRLLAFDPLQEPVHRTLMRLYVEAGRHGSALRQYQICVGALQRELGIEPDKDTRRLYEELIRRRARASERDERAAAAVRSGADVAHETTLIGREPELAAFDDALNSAGQGGGRFVAVIGEAGIGKSRLIGELASRASERGMAVLIGRAYEAEQILPFGPWVDAIRSARVLEDPDVLRHVSAAWRDELTRLFPELAEGDRPAEGPADYRRLFEAVARLIEAVTLRTPLVLILEDVHWADEMSARLLAFVGRRLAGWRAVVVATVREEELIDAAVVRTIVEDLALDHGRARLRLSPLSQAQTVALVKALTRRDGEAARSASIEAEVWMASRGHPFMIVETVRALGDGAGLVASTTTLPQRVREVITRRLERLSEPARHLATTAAVIGRDFDFGLLQHAVGLDESEAASRMEELVRRRIVHGIADRFDFTHDRIREVVYEGTFLPRRKLLHGIVGRAIESTYAADLTEHASALGFHFKHAEVWDKALVYLRQASAVAAARSAHRESAICSERALEVLGHLPESREMLEVAVDLRFDLRHALLHVGARDRIRRYLAEAETLAERLGDSLRLGRTLAFLTNALWAAAEHERAAEAGRRAWRLAEADGDFGLEVMARHQLGHVFHSQGRYREAIEVLTANVRALPHDRIGDYFSLAVPPAILSRAWLVWSLAELGEFAEAERISDELLELSAPRRAVDRIYACRGVGFLYLRSDRPARAAEVLERALDLCREYGVRGLVPHIAAPLSAAYAGSGRVGDAVALRREAVELGPEVGLHADQSLRLAFAGEAQVAAGDMTTARELASQARDLAGRVGERGNEAWALKLLGDVDSRRSSRDAAASHYRAAMDIGQSLGMAPLVDVCRTGLGRLSARG